MKVHPQTQRKGMGGHRRRESGSAVLVVLVLLFVMEVLIVANTRTLDHLDRELKFIAQKQQQKFAPVTPAPRPPAAGQPQKPQP